MDEPRIWPAFLKRARTPSVTSIMSSVSTGVRYLRLSRASSVVYRGAISSRAFRLFFRDCHWASVSWIWAASMSMMPQSWTVGPVVRMRPRNPSLTSLGIRPLWSMWAWVRNRASIWAGSKSHGRQLRCSIFLPPWNIPQSTRNFAPAVVSTRKLAPVTVPADPRQVTLTMALSFLAAMT